MADFLKEGEQALEGQGQQQGGDQQMGDQQGGQQQQSSGGGGGGMMAGAEDTMIDQKVDSFATSEGIPSGADNMINKEVNEEASKF